MNNQNLAFFPSALVLMSLLTSATFVQATPTTSHAPGQYIVVFSDNVTDASTTAYEIALRHGFGIQHVYSHALKGFASAIPLAKIDILKKDPRVAFINEDRIVEAWGKPTGGSTTQPDQTIPTGILRIGSQTASSTGSGVTVAVIDTGIDLSHPDLAGAIIANKSCIVGKKSGQDDNGHGTHVAGTIAARDNTIGVVGVAPQANLAAVKVLNAQGSGTWSSIICGIDWVTANAAKYNIKVANMSLGGAGSSDENCGYTNNDALHQALCTSRDVGVTYVVAAGNESKNAAQSVPAAYDDTVIAVSALADSDGKNGGAGTATAYGADDTFSSFSNYGSIVDIAAPGVSILSTWLKGQYNTISGTSMAAPHVSGAATLYLQSHPVASWMIVRNALQSMGENIGMGHTDPSGLHAEAVLQAQSL